ncbi:MAG: hypothetical protein ACI9K2_003032 [Myxococcota bacterium]|jgi:hypothetical protein
MRWSIVLLCALGCESSDLADDKPPAEICDNLEDDDLDELADCADPDCAALCGEVCTNGTDDDLDGLIDCLDDDCDGLCPENCGDGRDNDADGAIDCDDRDCFGSCPEVCGDGFDNDGDGKVDCLDEECVDPTCAEVCSDGRDNDADGLVDCADDDCNDPSCAEVCTDGRDNDADGRVDCDDSDCDGDCPEICDDGRDNDADGRIDCDDDECEALCDADGDGFFSEAFGGDDCDDSRADVNPSRPEICNGDEALDDDCDGLVDEDDPDIDVFTLTGWGPDADGDGFGTAADIRFACQQPEGWGFANLDCDDTRADVNPAMPEICNPEAPLDDDCDGLVDDADPDVTEDSYLEWYADRDGDGFGADDDFVYACSRPEGTAASDDDCDDADPDVGPPSLWFADGDADGFGAGEPVDPTPTCDPPGPGLRPDWVGLDCDDGEPRIYPDAPEVCEDGIDQDCDGLDRVCIEELVLTPDSGLLVEGDDPYWADKGYMFRATVDFGLAGGRWWIDCPADGFVRMSVYDWPGLGLLARGSAVPCSGVEEWVECDVEHELVAGDEYLVTFYTNRAESSLFDRQNGPLYGYSVDGRVSGVTGWSSSNSGDDAPEGTGAGGYLGNTWAPYQELLIRP